MKRTRHISCLVAAFLVASAVTPVFAENPVQTQPAIGPGIDLFSLKPAGPLTNAQRWYTSVLTQHQVISERIEEMREKLHQNLLGTQEFLDEVSTLFERADRLYATWKGMESAVTATPPNEEAARQQRPLDPPQREDAAVGKSLNYLRLSLINFFLGYCDSNGKQIDDAEKQARLSKLWRTRSKLFIKALDSQPPA